LQSKIDINMGGACAIHVYIIVTYRRKYQTNGGD